VDVVCERNQQGLRSLNRQLAVCFVVAERTGSKRRPSYLMVEGMRCGVCEGCESAGVLRRLSTCAPPLIHLSMFVSCPTWSLSCTGPPRRRSSSSWSVASTRSRAGFATGSKWSPTPRSPSWWSRCRAVRRACSSTHATSARASTAPRLS